MESIRYLVVPWVAPASPAFVVGVEFFRDLTINQNWSIALAAVAAITLAATIELGGAFSAMGIAQFWNDKSWLRVIISVCALLGYSYFGISLTWDTKLWPVFVFVTLLYLVIASFDTRNSQKKSEVNTLKLEAEIAKQNASAERAKARQAQFSISDSEKAPKINDKVRVYLSESDNPSKELIEDIAQRAGVSTSTASIHKKRFLAANG